MKTTVDGVEPVSGVPFHYNTEEMKKQFNIDNPPKEVNGIYQAVVLEKPKPSHRKRSRKYHTG